MSDPVWELRIAGPARKAINRLPAKVAVAVLDFIFDPLIANPHRVGRPLLGELTGLHSARVGAYRVVCEIDEASSTLTVLDIDHRSDIYRAR